MIDIDFNQIKSDSRKYNKAYIKKNYPEFYDEVVKLPGDTFAEQLFIYFNGQINQCVVCGKPTKFRSLSYGYARNCSYECCYKDKERVKKGKATKLERYGDANYNNRDKYLETCDELYGGSGFASATTRQKIEQTNVERYGIENISSITRDKVKQTCLERYGVSSALLLPENIELAKKALFDIYGSSSALSDQKVQQKAKETKFNRYGDSGYCNPKKRKQTMLSKYGEIFTNPEKTKQTCLEKYGVDSIGEAFADKIRSSKQQSTIQNYDFVIGFTNEGEWICRCPHPGCTKCKEKQYIISPINKYNRELRDVEVCTKLKPIGDHGNTSIETFVENILLECNVLFEKHNRTILNGREIDFYIPEFNLGIECNGVYFHSTSCPNFKSPKYHINKFLQCKQSNVFLLQIWEDQIINTPDIVKSIILNKLNKTPIKIYARKCEIKEVSKCDDFLIKNHIQGNANSSVRLGLFYNGEMVSLMTFGKRKGVISKDNKDWELIRFCNKIMTNVVGAASKLLTYFIKTYHPQNILSYSCNDISNGNLYKKLKFETDFNISPSYWYVDCRFKRYHRAKFTKQKLKALGYEGTESEIMKQLKYFKIYDSGNTKWIMEIKKEP